MRRHLHCNATKTPCNSHYKLYVLSAYYRTYTTEPPHWYCEEQLFSSQDSPAYWNQCYCRTKSYCNSDEFWEKGQAALRSLATVTCALNGTATKKAQWCQYSYTIDAHNGISISYETFTQTMHPRTDFGCEKYYGARDSIDYVRNITKFFRWAHWQWRSQEGGGTLS